MATNGEVKILGMEGTEQLVANINIAFAQKQPIGDYALASDIKLKQDAITGTAGQFVVIGEDGKPTTMTVPVAAGIMF